MSQHFAVVYTYGPPEEQAVHRPAHREYLGELLSRGSLLVSGPYTDGTPAALLIFRAESAEEVEALLRQDPMHLNGVVLDWQIHAWNPVLGTVGESGGQDASRPAPEPHRPSRTS